MPVEVGATLAGLELLERRVDDALRRIVGNTAEIFRDEAKENAPVGEEDNSTNPPGDLAESIIATPPVGGGGHWYAEVGPTAISVNPGPGGLQPAYGAQREFGGFLTPNVATYLAFTSHGAYVQKLIVYQFGSFYLTRARDETDLVEETMARELTAAVHGG